MRATTFVASIVAGANALQSLWTSGIGLFDPFIHRPIVLGMAVCAGLLYWPLAKMYDVEGLRAARSGPLTCFSALARFGDAGDTST